MFLLAEAVADANKAIEIDPIMHKAYFRKGLVTHSSFLLYIFFMRTYSHCLLYCVFIYVITDFHFVVLRASSLKNIKLRRLLLSRVLPMHLVTRGLLFC
jgi:hypothetical protein